MPSFSPISSDLHRECFQLFPDAMFADLFDDAGRRSVPPRPKVERKIGHLMRRPATAARQALIEAESLSSIQRKPLELNSTPKSAPLPLR